MKQLLVTIKYSDSGTGVGVSQQVLQFDYQELADKAFDKITESNIKKSLDGGQIYREVIKLY